MANSTAQKVEELLKPVITGLGFDLWDVRFLKEGASWYLRIYIDKPEGICIDDCTLVSHTVDPLLDEADPIEQSYYMEVCSAGLNRELVRPEHFEKMAGREVTVHLYSPRDGNKDFTGTLAGYDGGVTLDGIGYFEKGVWASVKLNDDI